ncbi:MAG TPA: caspase domain-containing protein [Pyrinomonadaceae bacterium]|nr:caspase domain-containing protein [Pyrinomonadaceae bacterium]
MLSFSKLKSWCASSLITFGIAGLLFGLGDSQSHAQQEPNRQLVQTNGQRAGNERRIALVIGNGAYTNAPPLKNPPNDARDMAATLKALGFEVSTGINVSQREMKRLMREFGQKLKAGGSGLFYYAGHGLQSKGRNYLIPVEADIQSEIEAEDAAVDVGLLLGYMDDAQNSLNIVILDACRNNPFARSFRSASSGLAQVDAPTGTLIAYATAPGRVAADGAGQNGLYTSELLKQMLVPGLTATEMFMRVRAEVMKETGNKQVPWEASSLVGSFYFNMSQSNTAVPMGASANETRIDPATFELSYWETIKNSTDPEDFKAYLRRYPAGQFTELAQRRVGQHPSAASAVYLLPTLGQQGRAVEIQGPFDGNYGNTSVKVGGNQVKILSESSEKLVFEAPGSAGPSELMLKEGQVALQGAYRNVRVTLSVPKTNLKNGERTTLTIAVEGLQGIQREVKLKIEISGVASFLEANTGAVSIQPQDVDAGGRCELKRTVIGNSVGNWSINVTVLGQ